MLKSKQLNICNGNLLLEPGHTHSEGKKGDRCVISVFHRTERFLQKAIQKCRIFWTALDLLCPFRQTKQGIQED